MMKFLKNSVLLIFVLLSVVSCRATSNTDTKQYSKDDNLSVNSLTNNQTSISDSTANKESNSAIEDTKADIVLDRKLLYAAKNGNDAQVQTFLKQGADVNALIDVKGIGRLTPLTWALSGSHESTAKILLEAGADVNRAADFEGSGLNEKNVTPLKIAAKNGLLEFVKIFVDKGADVNAATSNGDTPLMTGEVGVIKYLLENKANPNSVNNAGDTPLIFLVRYLKSYPESEISEGVKALTDRGAETGKTNKRGETAMSIADTNGAENIVNQLKSATPKSKSAANRY